MSRGSPDCCRAAPPFVCAFMEKNAIDLYTLVSQLREGVEDLFPARIWVKAEISSMQVRGGHCYLELSQSSDDGEILAKARAMIWSSRFRILGPYFRDTAGTPLSEGMRVLVNVQVTYSQLYGMALVVNDIDAEFTVGVKELERQRTIDRLVKEGLMDRQKSLQICPLPYRLAVITSDTAAGWGDFENHLMHNEFGFKLKPELFPALMQGAGSPASIVEAIEAVEASDTQYDAVLILRGGGARLDLVTYDDYSLAAAIARCPIPVYTAVGHDRDFHVCDMVAYEYVKTPTALADEFLSFYEAEDERISSLASALRTAFTGKVAAMESRVSLLESRILAADPRNVLKRGYVLVTDDGGVVVKSADKLTPGDRLRLLFADGTLSCTVDAREEAGNV